MHLDFINKPKNDLQQETPISYSSENMMAKYIGLAQINISKGGV